ncbi:hypothetical protein Tco_0681707 [Tanacetum coccineum]|uniref:Uncharacterized protein n=1 Tax=Tanacetum coccineum TaxID=301880 RepID=A0ABQ4XR19_9ASTR
MLESAAYNTYRAYATSEKTPKPKTTKKKADSESSPKTKSTQAFKGKRITTLAKGDKPAKKKQSTTKSKGLTVLSEVALTKAQHMKIAIERSKIQTYSSHTSGSGDEVHTYQGEDDEENDEHDSEDDNDEHDSENDNDDDEVSSDQMVSTPPNYKITDEEENQEDDDNVMGGEQEDQELYGDLNLNLDRRDAEMTDAQTNQETKEVHVTLTTEPPVVQQQSSSVSSDLVSKCINPTPDTGIDSILNPTIQSDIPVNVSVSFTTTTPSSNTTIPQTPIPIIQPQQQTHDSITITTIPATTLPNIPNFASLFRIVDNYLASQMKDAIDSNIKAIIKDRVKAQVSKIMPKVEKYVTESLGAEVLARSSNQPQTSYTALASLSEFESQPKSLGKSAQAEEHGLRVDDLEEPSHQEFNTGNDDVSPAREVTDVDARLWNIPGSQTPDREWNKTKTDLIKGTYKSVVELEYHLEEVFKATHDQLDWHNPEGRSYPHDLSKPLPLIQNARGKLTNLNLDERFALNVALRMYTRRIVIQEHVEDLQLAVESYQKKINLLKPDSYRSDLRKITPYTAYPGIQGIIYQDDMDRNRLMSTDELHKFSDGTLNHVRTALNDIATGIQMEYLPKRK